MRYACVHCDWEGEMEETIENELAYAACPVCGSEAQPLFENG